MSPVFNAEEILEVAVHIERTGAAYYRRAASFAENPAVKTVLEELADMEEGHELVFENLRANPDTLVELLGDPDGEIVKYLHAFIEGQVFPKDQDASSLVGPDTEIDEVLRQGITMELKSIAFYQGIKDAVPEEFGQKKVEAIIAEERSHVTLLSRQLASIRSQKAGK